MSKSFCSGVILVRQVKDEVQSSTHTRCVSFESSWSVARGCSIAVSDAGGRSPPIIYHQTNRYIARTNGRESHTVPLIRTHCRVKVTAGREGTESLKCLLGQIGAYTMLVSFWSMLSRRVHPIAAESKLPDNSLDHPPRQSIEVRGAVLLLCNARTWTWTTPPSSKPGTKGRQG